VEQVLILLLMEPEETEQAVQIQSLFLLQLLEEVQVQEVMEAAWQEGQVEVQEETLIVLPEVLELLGKEMQEEQGLEHLMETPEAAEARQV
jgi:hypothetical protein